MLGVTLLITDYGAANRELKDEIVRNDYGNGVKTEELQIKVDGGERKNLEVEISERMYTEDEISTLFQRCIQKIEKELPGENESMERVENDLNLMTELPGEPVEISWTLDQYEVMNVYGKIQEEHLTEEGTLVNLEAVITYRENQDYQTVYQCAAVVYPKSLEREDSIIRKVKHVITKENEMSRMKTSINLPKSIDGAKLEYYYPMDYRGCILMMLSVVAGVLFYIQEIQKREKELQNKEKQMMLDYPEIINKLTLFLGAGMNVKRAWKKIVQDYEMSKNVWGIRYAFEEMKITAREMESGVPESESYERFGKRCNVQAYIRLGALLSQNIRKGTKGLNQILRLEAVQAFENRKAYAKMAGEEAGTKLLVPMFLMLAIVLVMVTIPAFLSMKL